MDFAQLGLDTISEATLLQPWFASAPASLVLQMIAIVRLRGVLRSLAMILTLLTGTILGLVLVAYRVDPGNLWELLLRLTTVPLFVLTTGLLLIGLAVGPRARSSR